MKKAMMFVCAALLSGVVYAEEPLNLETLEQVKDNATTITYTFSISRNESCDEQAWSKALESATQAAKVAIASEGNEVSSEEMVQAILRAMQDTYEQCGGKDGINGDIKIWFDNGNAKGCDGICGGDDDRGDK